MVELGFSEKILPMQMSLDFNLEFLGATKAYFCAATAYSCAALAQRADFRPTIGPKYPDLVCQPLHKGLALKTN